tara:strand:- start:53 stop:1006 length:954 start_codon:yes stop_codon:yes gene_type:complete
LKNNRSIINIKDRYTSSLLDGNLQDAFACVSYILAEGWGEKFLYKKIFTESLREIGEMWHNGEISISHENRASSITLELMARLRQSYIPKDNSPLVVVTTPKSDSHSTGARMFADFLLMDGWKVDFITNQVPLFDLKKFIQERLPDLVAISVTMDSSLEECDEITQSLQSEGKVPKIIWGGPAINRSIIDRTTDYEKNDEPKVLNFQIKNINYQIKSSPDFVCCTSEFFESNKCSKFLTGFHHANAKINLDQTLEGIGIKIKNVRTNLGLSQTELANMSSMDRAFLSSVENGKRNLSISALHKISDALNISINELMN